MLATRSARRWFAIAATAAVALVAAGCGDDEASTASSGDGGRPVVKATTLEGTQSLPLILIEQRKLDEKHGFDLEQDKVAGAEAAYERAKQGSFQLGFGSWLTIALLRGQGFDLTTAYPLSAPTTNMLVQKGADIRSFADLEGKTIGLFGGPSAGTTVLLQVLLDKYYGIKPEDVKFRSGAAGLLGAQLERGQLDAALIQDPIVEKLIAGGKVRSIGDPALLWRDRTGVLPMQVNVFANEKWAEKNPEVMRSFLAAYQEAKSILMRDDAVWASLAKTVGITDTSSVGLYRDRIRKLLIADWSQPFLDKQSAFVDEVAKTLGDITGFPKKLPEGTFTTEYAPTKEAK